MGSRTGMTVHIDCGHDRAVVVRAGGQGVWLSLENPDGDGEVQVGVEDLAAAVRFVSGDAA